MVSAFMPFLKSCFALEGLASSSLEMKGGFRGDLLHGLAQVIMDFQAACKESLTLRACCVCLLEMERFSGLSEQEAGCGWVAAALSARSRFEKLLKHHTPLWIQERLQADGPDSAWGFLNSCNLPGFLKPYQAVLVQTKFLEGLEIPQQGIQPGQELMKQVKNYVTLKTLSHKHLKFLLPDMLDKINGYTSRVVENIGDFSKDLAGQVNSHNKILEKYRPGSKLFAGRVSFT